MGLRDRDFSPRLSGGSLVLLLIYIYLLSDDEDGEEGGDYDYI